MCVCVCMCLCVCVRFCGWWGVRFWCSPAIATLHHQAHPRTSPSPAVHRFTPLVPASPLVSGSPSRSMHAPSSNSSTPSKSSFRPPTLPPCQVSSVLAHRIRAALGATPKQLARALAILEPATAIARTHCPTPVPGPAGHARSTKPIHSLLGSFLRALHRGSFNHDLQVPSLTIRVPPT